MNYKSYTSAYRGENSEIGTAFSNVSGERVIIITMFRPSYLAISTKNQLENLYNFLELEDDKEKTRIMLKDVSGKEFEHFAESTQSDKGIKVQIALEILKKMLRYDEFPNSVKFQLVQDDQIRIHESGVYLREVVNFTNHDPITDQDIIASIGNMLCRLLPDLDGAEATLLEQMKLGNNDFYSIADVYSAFRDVFIYKIPAQLEKRIYFSLKGGETIDGHAVDEFIRQEETRRLELAKQREEISREYKIDAFEQKIENQTKYSESIDTDGFESKELKLEKDQTKQLPGEVDEFEIIRTIQPKTIDLNEVTNEITNNLQNIVDEFNKYGKQKIDDESAEEAGDKEAKATETAASDDPAADDAVITNRKNKKKKNRNKRKNKKIIETEKLESFADEALESLSEIQDDDLQKTTALDEVDKDSPFHIYRHFETSKLEDGDTSDLDEFYKVMDNLGNKNSRAKKIAGITLIAVFICAIFVIALMYFKALSQPIVPGFTLTSPTVKTIQCTNDSLGKMKISKCLWKVYNDGQLLAESEGNSVSFSFENVGKYEIHMILIDKDGKELEPIVKTYNHTHDVTEPSNP